MWLSTIVKTIGPAAIAKGVVSAVRFFPKLKGAYKLLGIINQIDEFSRLLGDAVTELRSFIKTMQGHVQEQAKIVLKKFDAAFEKLADICSMVGLKSTAQFLRDLIPTK